MKSELFLFLFTENEGRLVPCNKKLRAKSNDKISRIIKKKC